MLRKAATMTRQYAANLCLDKNTKIRPPQIRNKCRAAVNGKKTDHTCTIAVSMPYPANNNTPSEGAKLDGGEIRRCGVDRVKISNASHPYINNSASI